MKGLLLKLIPDAVIEFSSTRAELFLLIQISALIIVSLISWYISKKFVKKIVYYYVKKSDNAWDDIIYEKRVFDRLAHIVPAMFFYVAADIFMEAGTAVRRLAISYMIFVVMLVFKSAGNAALEIYEHFPISKDRPIKGLIQVLNIFVFFIGSIVIVAILMGKSPALLLSGLGAMTAILLLIFKDSILGFVAGIQIVANKSIKKGDWITMSKFDADGEVIDIALHVVKVQNWDNTIVYIPAAKFLEESFSNWRGVIESGARRLYRSLIIDVTSIRFLTAEEIEKFKKVQILNEYITSRTAEIEQWNNENHTDRTVPVNGRRLTNIGTFREYVKLYIESKPDIRKDKNVIVRQLQQNEYGIPLQIVAFTGKTALKDFETLQSDIFDHLFASSEFFGIRLFQRPSGHDMKHDQDRREP